MKKLAASLCALSLLAPIGAFAKDPVVPHHTLHAMGCMKLRECTEGVIPIESMADVKGYYPLSAATFSQVEEEANNILAHLKEIGVQVYLGDGKYFPLSHRGAYYTDDNMFFLNANHMEDPKVFLEVLRHEGWHVAQDCMAGTVNNTMMAVIHHDGDVPDKYKMDAEIRYFSSPSTVPWEQEAVWAGSQENMTEQALSACSSDQPMWEIYPPTPMTHAWLVKNGYIDE